MKFTSLLFISMLLSISFAIRMDSLKNAKFAKSKLGKFIVNFAEFTSSMKDPDYDPLFDALDSLTQALEDQLAQAQQANADAEVDHNNLIINYENNRDNANSDVVSAQQTLASLADDQVTYSGEISQAQTDIANDNQQLVDLASERSDRVALYEEDVANVNSGLDSIDEALTYLRSLQTSSDVASFIQTNEKALNDVKAKLQKSFEAISAKKRAHYRYRPLLLAVVEIMTKQNFVNQDSLGRVIALLVDLRASLSDHLTALDNEETDAETNYNNVVDALNSAIELSTSDLNTAQSNLDNTNGNFFLLFYKSFFLNFQWFSLKFTPLFLY